MYDRLAHTWWDESTWLNMPLTTLGPARIGYLRDALADHGLDPVGATALDIGCGGGHLAEEVARLGFSVTGVDPSAPSLATARDHARSSGLEIDYVEGRGEAIPVEDAAFDLAYSFGTLEHVDDVGAVLLGIRGVLKPGGLFVYDMFNRTPASKLFVIKLSQDWRATRVVEPGLHDHAMFIKPAELEQELRSSGFEPRGSEGLQGSSGVLTLLRLMRARRRGEITMGEYAARTRMERSDNRSVAYIGHALAT